MVFIKARRNQFLLAWPLTVAVTALTVAACGGSPAASAQGPAAGHWTHAEVSQFAAASGSDGSAAQNSCVVAYFERDMSFENAMAVVAVAPSSASMSAAQIEAAVVTKYGSTKGDAINGQFGRAISDSGNNCRSLATSPTTPAAVPTPAPDPAATDESSCSIDCVDPVASGESGWLAQVQGALQNVQQDLTALSSDASSDPANVAVDGSDLEADAQAALDPSYDPPPADNADWVTAMNDYVTAGEDYAGDNTNEQDDNPAQANQELGAANAALATFNAANGGVLNGTIQPS
jgi:hypothetical protein